MNVVVAAVICLASGTSAFLSCRRLPSKSDQKLWLLGLPVAWIVFLLVPVHVLAALQLAKIIERVTIPALMWLELVITLGVLIITRILPWPAGIEPIRRTGCQLESIPTYVLISAGLVGAAYLLAAVNLCTSFPEGIDALAYHLPLSVRWLQQGSLGLPVSGGWRFSLPGNGEILAMLALSTGKQWLAPLFNWFSCVVLALSLYALVRRLTAGTRAHGLLAVLIALSLPPVFFQTFSAFVDLFGTAFLLAGAVLFLHRYSSLDSDTGTPKLSRSVLVLSGLSCGITLGTKPIFYVYGGFLLVWVVITLWRERSIHRQPMLVLVALVGSGMLLPSAFWLLRAWQGTGNPLYPMQIKIGQHTIGKGYSPSEITPQDFADRFVRGKAEWLIYPWTEWVRDPGTFPSSYNEGAGVGAAFATFVPLGIAFAIYDLRSGRSRRPGFYLLLLVWVVLLLIWASVLHRLPRFGLPLWVAACVFAVPLFDAIESVYPKTFRALLLISLASTLVISSLNPLHALVGRIVKHRWSRSAFYQYPPVIDDLPPGSKVLNDTGILEKEFALAGTKLTNWVVPTFEEPKELTEDYLASQRIDYIVEAVQDPESGRIPPRTLPSSIAVTQVDKYKVPGRTWYVYKVAPR